MCFQLGSDVDQCKLPHMSYGVTRGRLWISEDPPVDPSADEEVVMFAWTEPAPHPGRDVDLKRDEEERQRAAKAKIKMENGVDAETEDDEDEVPPPPPPPPPRSHLRHSTSLACPPPSVARTHGRSPPFNTWAGLTKTTGQPVIDCTSLGSITG